MPRTIVSIRAFHLLGGALWSGCGIALLAAALPVVDERDTGVLLFLLGAGLFGLVLLSRVSRGSFFRRRDDAVPAPADAREEPLRLVALHSMVPSGTALVLFSAAGLLVDARLTALLAGFLVAGGGIKLWLAADQILWERRNRVRLYADRDAPSPMIAQLRGLEEPALLVRPLDMNARKGEEE